MTGRPTSWPRLKLGPFIGMAPELPEVAGLFYAGRRHLISGAGEAMKTWLCLAAAAAEVKAGRGVIWADLDGMGPREITSRLVALGLSDQEIDELVFFTNPEGQLGAVELADLIRWARLTDCRLFVADAFTGFLVAHGLAGNEREDVEQAWRRLDGLCDADIAVVLIDHVVKNPDNRNGQATGSERKGTAAHLHFDLKSIGAKLSRCGTGRSSIGVSRDRGAYFPRPLAGELVVFSDADTGAITWTINPPRADGEPFRPTNLMEKVSRHIEASPGAPKSDLEEAKLGKAEYVRDALAILIDEKYVRVEIGAKGAHQLHSLKPYREAEDLLVPSSSLGGTT